MLYPYYYGYGFGAWGFFSHIVGLIIGLAVLAIVLRFLFGSRHNWRHRRHLWHSPALDMLDERYAKGEISKEEYEERRKTILGQ